MDKLISQQAAIEAVVGCTNCGTEDVLRAYVTKHSLENGWTGGIVDALDAIEQLPSIQPETTVHDSNVVKTGKNDGDRTSGDCISRQAAIYEIHEDADWLASQGSDWQTERMERDKSILMSLPSAQPETAKRIVGKSRDGMTLWYQCDMCNEPVDEHDNFCRGCGRRLIDEATSERLTNRKVVSK